MRVRPWPCGDQHDAVSAPAQAARCVAVIAITAGVKDMQAVKHDYILMGLHLKTDEEYAGVGG